MPDSQPTLGFVLHDVARFLRKRFEQNAKSLGLTRSQWQALSFLARNEGIHQAGLAEIMEIEGITLVRILDKLESCGLVERRSHPTDRRIWLLHLTDKARPLLEQLRVIGDQTRAEALEGISDTHRADLMRMLLTMKNNLVQAAERPAKPTHSEP